MGDGVDTLKLYIVDQESKFRQQRLKLYGRSFAIIQSAGMAKSRLISEFGLQPDHFMLPICLRRADQLGFPPGDNAVQNFLVRNTVKDSSESRKLRRSVCSSAGETCPPFRQMHIIRRTTPHLVALLASRVR